MAIGPNIFNDAELDLWNYTRSLYPWKSQKGEIFQTYNDTPMLNLFFDPKKKVVEGGKRLEWEAAITDTGDVKFVTPNTNITYNIADVSATFSANWTLAHHYYGASRDEIKQNAVVDTQLRDLLLTRRGVCHQAMGNRIEQQLLILPALTGSEANLQPYGASYSIVPITGAQVTAGTYGFQGMNAVGFTDCYGVDSSAAKYAKYRNWNDVWTNSGGAITWTDIKKVLRMLRHLDWKPCMNAQQFVSGERNNMMLVVGETILENASDLTRDQNDNLGADLGRFSGQVVTKGIPWVWLPVMDDSTYFTQSQYSLMALDTNSMVPVVYKDEFFREDPAKFLQNQPRMSVVDVWLKYQLVNRNRRRCGRIDYVAAG